MSSAAVALVIAPAATLVAFLVAKRVQRIFGNRAWLNPVLLAAAAIAVLAPVAGLDRAHLAPTVDLCTWLLGPHMVLLAVPLYRYRDEILRARGIILPAVLAGGMSAILSALVVARLAGLDEPVGVTLATKSITTAVAMDVASLNGGLPHLASLTVILTGVFGACLLGAPWRVFGAPCPQAQGLALGIAAHALGTARALGIGERVAAFACIGMILNAIVTAAALPGLLLLLS